EIQSCKSGGDRGPFNPSKYDRRLPFVEGSRETDLLVANVRSNRIRTNDEHNGISTSNQCPDALPPFFKCIDLRTINESLYSARREGGREIVGKIAIPTGIGDKYLRLDFAGITARITVRGH